MLEEYKNLCYQAASVAPGWEKLTKNELCRRCSQSRDNPILYNAYLSGVLYRYWHLIPKYYYMSANCAQPETCYEWLVDSATCCVNLAMWNNPDSSIYKDPNGPDKVINRCMKCARLTHYQYINRKKRKDDFGLLSLEELQELFGNGVSEPVDASQEYDLAELSIKNYVVEMFEKKDYFVAFLIDCILGTNVFELNYNESNVLCFEFNERKLVKFMNNIDDGYALMFSESYNIVYADVIKALSYVKCIPPSLMKKKIDQTLEKLKHSKLIKSLMGV